MNRDLFQYTTHLGDNALVLGQRLAEWCGGAPYLEIDIALTNLSLDLIGQARMFLSYAGEVEGAGRGEDDLAMGRDVFDYRNLLLVEQPNGDFAQTIARHFLFASYQDLLFRELAGSKDAQIAAIAAKSLKEIAYHIRFSGDWMRRLGDGTEESRARLDEAVSNLWRFVDEMFDAANAPAALVDAGCAPDPARLKAPWDERIDALFSEIGLARPAPVRGVRGGVAGRHTEHLGHMLAEMQFLHRAYPGANW
ncbi:MAG: phenylacetate-CoA oxygenase subunit PaaC [Parvularculaceae bacterium]